MANNRSIEINGRKIGSDQPPYVIAEMSGNHNQSLDRALEIVDAAAATGAHALKLQTYTADTLTIDCDAEDFFISNMDSPWYGKTLYELYEEASTPWDWHEAIFERCRKHNLTVFSSPFDHTAIEFLEELGAPAYKIASFENTDLHLLKAAARTGKPVIVSLGMATLAEIEQVVDTVKASGNEQILLLKCTSAYPANAENANIRTIPNLAEALQCPVGLSDHTLGIGVAVASVALGAVAIEKHFTLARADGGVDSEFSLEPDEMKALVTESERAWHAMGQVHYGRHASESASLTFRRSIYVVKDVQCGERLTSEHIRVIRPGYGMAPSEYDNVLGRRVNCDLKRGASLQRDYLD